MKELLNSIAKIGIKSEYDEAFQKRLQLQNISNILACLVYLIVGIIYFFFNDYKTAVFILCLAAFNFLSFYFQKKYVHAVALSLFLVSGYLSVFYFDSYAGLHSGAFLYYPAIMLSLFFLFDLQKDKAIIVVHLIAIVVLILIHHFTNRSLFASDVVTNEMRARLLIANTILSTISILYFIALAIKSKAKR
jgi:hypothetical protein